MATQFTSNDVLILSIIASRTSNKIAYTFSLNGIKYTFSGRLHNKQEIRGIEYSDNLEKFINSLMQFDHKISKKLSSITWTHVNENAISFPVLLTTV